MYHGPLRIDFLFTPGCCCASPALRLLRQVLNEEHRDPVVRIIVIATEEEAIRHQFHGSPTILVDGVDLEGASIAREGYRLRCRVYQRHADCLGVPHPELIRSALHTHPGLRRPSGVP